MKNVTSNRFSQDETGQWWFLPKDGTNFRRTKAHVGICKQCGDEFLSRSKEQKTCSSACRFAWLSKPKTERFCLHCKERITSKSAYKYCSHVCACKAMQKRKPVTTRIAANVDLFNSDNPRYSKDEQGQWWYKPIGTKDHGRTRAYVKECERCKGKFLACIFNRKSSKYCSRSCSGFASNEADPGRFKGEKGGNYKGGRRLDKRGYVLILAPDHPTKRKVSGLYMFEHRLVMEKTLGRYLEPHEEVHHRNGIRDDNRPENLELWVKRHPGGQRARDLLAFARWVIETYEPIEALLP